MPERRFLRARRRPYSIRPVGTREIKERFLIVCEGRKTEPNYFRAFRVNRNVVSITVRGTGRETLRVVNEAIAMKNSDDYDQVWCVFDRDSFPREHFSKAIELATRNGIEVAYSNLSFELWYLLHFHFNDTSLSQRDYEKKLSIELGHNYTKNSETIYGELLEKQATAIRNAKRLLKCYSRPKPEHDNPSTTVHLLVEQLNKFLT